jgi:hypothetical protein
MLDGVSRFSLPVVNARLFVADTEPGITALHSVFFPACLHPVSACLYPDSAWVYSFEILNKYIDKRHDVVSDHTDPVNTDVPE